MVRENDLGQPVGEDLPSGWSPPPYPLRQSIDGRLVRIEPIEIDTHAKDLSEANQRDRTGAGWTYMSYGPFETFGDFCAWAEKECVGTDPLFFAYVAKSSGKAIGWGSYLRIAPEDGSIEVGSIQLSPLLRRTAMATEALHLMLMHAFELGYRRCEWKCNALNAPSRRAALRLGFTFEGVFRQATNYKGRNRDTTWYSIVDQEWPRITKAHRAWLEPSNIDAAGQQIAPLSSFMSLLVE